MRRDSAVTSIIRIISGFALIVLLALTSGSCHVGRYFVRNTAGVNDYRFFPKDPIQGAVSVSPLPRQGISRLPGYEGMIGDESIGEFLIRSRSTSFLVLKEGKMHSEWYAEGLDSNMITSAFSVSKAVVSSLIGIAITDGAIKSLDEPVRNYLAWLDPSLGKLTFRHLLNMKAGLNFRERYYTPFSPMAKYYYGRRLDKYARHLKAEYPAGSKYEYQSATTLIAGMALEKATGKDLCQYLSAVLWVPGGMGQGSSWSLDRPGGEPKYFSGLNTRPVDLLRFGRLFLGTDGPTRPNLIPREWIKLVITDTEHSKDSQGYPYQLGWRITPAGGIFAKGILGQYVYINFEHQIVIVRTGKSSRHFDWGTLFDTLATSI